MLVQIPLWYIIVLAVAIALGLCISIATFKRVRKYGWREFQIEHVLEHVTNTTAIKTHARSTSERMTTAIKLLGEIQAFQRKGERSSRWNREAETASPMDALKQCDVDVEKWRLEYLNTLHTTSRTFTPWADLTDADRDHWRQKWGSRNLPDSDFPDEQPETKDLSRRIRTSILTRVVTDPTGVLSMRFECPYCFTQIKTPKMTDYGNNARCPHCGRSVREGNQPFAEEQLRVTTHADGSTTVEDIKPKNEFPNGEAASARFDAALENVRAKIDDYRRLVDKAGEEFKRRRDATDINSRTGAEENMAGPEFPQIEMPDVVIPTAAEINALAPKLKLSNAASTGVEFIDLIKLRDEIEAEIERQADAYRIENSTSLTPTAWNALTTTDRQYWRALYEQSVIDAMISTSKKK